MSACKWQQVDQGIGRSIDIDTAIKGEWQSKEDKRSSRSSGQRGMCVGNRSELLSPLTSSVDITAPVCHSDVWDF